MRKIEMRVLVRFVFICVLISMGSVAKSVDDDLLSRLVVIHGQNYEIHCHVLVDKVDEDVNLETVYYWYQHDKIQNNKGGYAGVLLHGKYQKYDQDKHLLEKGTFHCGKKVGIWKYWDTKGELKKTLHWKNGHKKGWECVYLEEDVWIKSQYKSDVLHGKRITHTKDSIKVEIYRQGKLIRENKEPKIKPKKPKRIKKKKSLKKTEKEKKKGELVSEKS